MDPGGGRKVRCQSPGEQRNGTTHADGGDTGQQKGAENSLKNYPGPLGKLPVPGEGLDQDEYGREPETPESDDPFRQCIKFQGIPDTDTKAAEQKIAEGEPPQKSSQNDGRSWAVTTEQSAEVFLPGDLVDEPRGTGQKNESVKKKSMDTGTGSGEGFRDHYRNSPPKFSSKRVLAIKVSIREKGSP